MSEDHENLAQDTGIPEPPLPATDVEQVWDELTRTNSRMKQLQKMIMSGLGSLAGDVGVVERRMREQEQAYTRREERDLEERRDRQRYIDRLLWAALALIGAHLVIDVIRMVRGRSNHTTE